MSHRKPGVWTEVSLFFCPGRAFHVSLNISKRNVLDNPHTTECLVLTNLTKEGQPSRDGFVPGSRISTHPALSNKCYPLASLARITLVMKFVTRKETEIHTPGELEILRYTERCLGT